MYVSDEGKKIPLFFAEDRSVAVLKKMSCPSMPFVEVEGIPCKKPSHDAGDTPISAPQQEMNVVAHQRPGIEGASGYGNILAELIDEPLSIRLIDKEIASVYSPG